jgi:hypothetical protein
MNVEAATLPPNEAGSQRWIVLVAAVIGIGLAAYGLALAWDSDTGTVRARLYQIMRLGTAITMFCICWLIAWRAGRSTANMSMALALMAIHLESALAVVLRSHGLDGDPRAETVATLMFGVGAALFVRASQNFPRLITANVISTSSTFWGKMRITRVVLTALLRPALLWPLTMAIAASITLLGGQYAEIARLAIVALGVVYFYISYRAGDADARRKVLWFLAAAVATAIVSLLVVAFNAVVGEGGSEALRTVVGVSLVGLDNLSRIVFIAAAVFYVGAVSPSLVIRKTMVYGLTTALLLFVFATAEVFLHHQIVHLLHVTDTLASSLLGGAFGLTFHPVKHYSESLLDRFLQRHGKPPAHASH